MYKLNTLPIFSPNVIGLDIETTGKVFYKDEIRLIGISDGYTTWVLTEGFERIVPILEDPNCIKVIHNAIFDLPFICSRYTCKPKNVWDSLIVERVINYGNEIGNDLENTLARRLGVLVDKTLQKSFINYHGPITPEQLDYLENDCKYLLPLYKSQLAQVANDGLGRVVSLENYALLPVLDMVLTGVGFDLAKWEEVRSDLGKVVADIESKIHKLLGYDFYIEVPREDKKKGAHLETINVVDIKFGGWQQLGCVLDKLGIKTETTRKGELESIENDHPFISLLLEWKFWKKMMGWQWQKYISPVSGRIHPGWNQVGADSGRFSCKEPNLQNIPKDTGEKDENGNDLYPNLRRLFSGLPGHVLITADYSQQEPRILAGVSGDPAMLRAAQEKDIYIAFAREIYKKEVTKKDKERNLTKIGVLSTFYGKWYETLAPVLGVTVAEAQEFQKSVKSAYPMATAWGDSQFYKVRQCGYSKTLIGRRRYIPEIKDAKGKRRSHFEKVCRNNPIQGTGADATKLALWYIYKGIQEMGCDAHIIMTIHDEIVVSSHPDCSETVFKLVVDSMENAASAVCPGVKFIAEGKISEVWEH
jgi:DNA polymerase-1